MLPGWRCEVLFCDDITRFASVNQLTERHSELAATRQQLQAKLQAAGQVPHQHLPSVPGRALEVVSYRHCMDNTTLRCLTQGAISESEIVLLVHSVNSMINDSHITSICFILQLCQGCHSCLPYHHNSQHPCSDRVYYMYLHWGHI